MTNSTNIFISYSHANSRWLDLLELHLKPLERTHKITVWRDTKLIGGDHWNAEINKALESADAAILLISPAFLASDFINNTEVPELLKNEKKKGMRILPLIISSCQFSTSPLGEFQAINDPNKPLDSMPNGRVHKILTELCNTISSLFTKDKKPSEEATALIASPNKVISSLGGLINYYHQYPSNRVFNDLGNAKNKIQILQTWISNWHTLRDMLKKSLQISNQHKSTNVQVQIILIDPSSALTEIRGIHSGLGSNEATSFVNTTFSKLSDFKEEHNLNDDQLEIRIHTELPTFAMFRSDSKIYFNPYLRLRTTYESPCFEFWYDESSIEGFANQLVNHFETLWESLKP